ncbi:MAG TPA: succinate dehydrogenase, hydrophobic membrane anchor protein [Burkholderiales bacterium]|nr:succinate dehydrogenase, hydrophobic membrane anchor protein [Burkholderiales bacterium]
MLVGAHYGARDWLMQRLTATVMAAYTLLLVIAVATMPQADLAHWRALWSQPWMRYVSFLFLMCVFYHAWIGVRTILMDYVHHTGLRLLLYGVVVLALVAYAAWSIQILWSI